MMRALYSAASGMLGQQLNMDTISNNLANVNTTAYKKQRVEFQDVLYSTIRNSRANVPVGVQVGSGSRPAAINTVLTNGVPMPTDNAYDLYISGPGYFRVINPANEAVPFYTRDGSFKRDAAGNLTTTDGYFLDDGNGQPVNIPNDGTDFTVSAEGQITYRDANNQIVEIGTLQIFDFVNPAGLNRTGRNFMQETAASGAPVAGTPGTEGRGYIVQKALEASNVAVVDEMVSMITASRAYEANTKSIQASDEMLQQANGLKR